MKRQISRKEETYEHFAIGMTISLDIPQDPERQATNVAKKLLMVADQMGLDVKIDSVYDDIDSSDFDESNTPFYIYTAEFDCEPIRELDLADLIKDFLKTVSKKVWAYVLDGEGPNVSSPQPSWVAEATTNFYNSQEDEDYSDEE